FFCSLLAPSDAILFQEGVSVKLRLPHYSPPPPICSRQAAVVLYRQRRARVKNELYICHFFHDISFFM
ncbi:hypothetical protein P4I15_22040, partial [Escherichia coli]|uniref:hypothetical protein n=1 Tax=Escherichia coli TaxID=562 RepID=UPI003CE82845